jgi:hypothetical protein
MSDRNKNRVREFLAVPTENLLLLENIDLAAFRGERPMDAFRRCLVARDPVRITAIELCCSLRSLRCA